MNYNTIKENKRLVYDKLKVLLILFFAIFTPSSFGIDYFWLDSIKFSDKKNGYYRSINVSKIPLKKQEKYFNKPIYVLGGNGKITMDRLMDKVYYREEGGYDDEGPIAKIFIDELIPTQKSPIIENREMIILVGNHTIEKFKKLTLREASPEEKKKYVVSLKKQKKTYPKQQVSLKAIEYVTKNINELKIVKQDDRIAIWRDSRILINKKLVYVNEYGLGSNRDYSFYYLTLNGSEFLVYYGRSYIYHKEIIRARKTQEGYYLMELKNGAIKKVHLPIQSLY